MKNGSILALALILTVSIPTKGFSASRAAHSSFGGICVALGIAGMIVGMAANDAGTKTGLIVTGAALGGIGFLSVTVLMPTAEEDQRASAEELRKKVEKRARERFDKEQTEKAVEDEVKRLKDVKETEEKLEQEEYERLKKKYEKNGGFLKVTDSALASADFWQIRFDPLKQRLAICVSF